MTDLTKPPDDKSGIQLNKGKLSAKASPFQQRVNQAKAEQIDPATMPNRICLMLDRSSSMSQLEDLKNRTASRRRIDLLKEAVGNFAQRCDFSNTSIAIETFPAIHEIPLTTNQFTITMAMHLVDASGNTPMHRCLQVCLVKVPMTRGVVVSDGEATDWTDDDVFDSREDWLCSGPNGTIDKYKHAGIPIDCVHIGDSASGEDRLRRIARETGGVFLKFTDVSAFASAFGYLTPSFRAMLTDGRVDASQLGAKELNR
jgi:Mg-chelatase subunit ChlD